MKVRIIDVPKKQMYVFLIPPEYEVYAKALNDRSIRVLDTEGVKHLILNNQQFPDCKRMIEDDSVFWVDS